MKIFCLPFAGGNSHSYRALQAYLPAAMTVQGVELPGRGIRAAEPLCRSLEALADDLYGHLARDFAAGVYALFGHSMGAATAYLLMLRIRAGGLPLPHAVVLSGKSAPSLAESRSRHLLGTVAFRAMLKQMGGCPPEVLAEKELMDYFEPILRADFEAVETWRPARGEPLDVPALVLHGRQDEMPRAHLEAWASEFSSPVEFHEFEGGHFFIQRHWAQIARLVVKRIG